MSGRASGPSLAAELRPFRVGGTVRPSDARKPTPPELTHSRLRVGPAGACWDFPSPARESTEFTALPPPSSLAGQHAPSQAPGGGDHKPPRTPSATRPHPQPPRPPRP